MYLCARTASSYELSKFAHVRISILHSFHHYLHLKLNPRATRSVCKSLDSRICEFSTRTFPHSSSHSFSDSGITDSRNRPNYEQGAKKRARASNVRASLCLPRDRPFLRHDCPPRATRASGSRKRGRTS